MVEPVSSRKQQSNSDQAVRRGSLIKEDRATSTSVTSETSSNLSAFADARCATAFNPVEPITTQTTMSGSTSFRMRL
jgi:hypothetical protein